MAHMDLCTYHWAFLLGNLIVEISHETGWRIDPIDPIHDH